jgi:hypothetical protein
LGCHGCNGGRDFALRDQKFDLGFDPGQGEKQVTLGLLVSPPLFTPSKNLIGEI